MQLIPNLQKLSHIPNFVVLNCLNHFVEKYELEITDYNNLAEYYVNAGYE